MPFDPFFTSKARDEFHEQRQKARAIAKAYQLRVFLGNIPKARRQKAIDHRLDSNPETLAVRAIKKARKGGAMLPVGGGHSVSGFKPPKKIWDEPPAKEAK
jgi:hypothetical protein